MTSQSTKSVCVIGAGPSGLCALRHLKDKFSKVVAFEQGDQLGGLWVYTDQTGEDDDGVLVHSSMYKNLRFDFYRSICNSYQPTVSND